MLTLKTIQITSLTAESQWAQQGETADGDQWNGDGSGDTSAAETDIAHSILDRTVPIFKLKNQIFIQKREN